MRSIHTSARLHGAADVRQNSSDSTRLCDASSVRQVHTSAIRHSASSVRQVHTSARRHDAANIWQVCRPLNGVGARLGRCRVQGAARLARARSVQGQARAGHCSISGGAGACSKCRVHLGADGHRARSRRDCGGASNVASGAVRNHLTGSAGLLRASQ